MHHIVLWKWADPKATSRERITAEHVNTMAAMIRRHLPRDRFAYRIICITDDHAGIRGADVYRLWTDGADLRNASGDTLPSCYRRLKLYDPATQDELDISPGDRIVSLDMDTVITGDITEILQQQQVFVGWEMIGTLHRRVLNGSFQMFTAGKLAFLWKTFNPATSPAAAHAAGYMGSDQAWLSWHLAPRLDDQVKGLSWPLIASYPLQSKLQGLHAGTRIVFFHGSEKPWQDAPQRTAPWITQHWRRPNVRS